MNKLVCTILSLILIGLTAACSDDTEMSDELLSDVNTAKESEDTAEIVQSETSILSGKSDRSNTKEENILNIEITAQDRKFSAELYETETAEILPLTLDMSELNGNEKFFYLSDDLPTNSECPEKINSGDIMLYGSSCVVLFYDSFSTSYSYTPIGHIDDTDGLAEALGKGSVTVTFGSAK